MKKRDIFKIVISFTPVLLITLLAIFDNETIQKIIFLFLYANCYAIANVTPDLINELKNQKNSTNYWREESLEVDHHLTKAYKQLDLVRKHLGNDIIDSLEIMDNMEV